MKISKFEMLFESEKFQDSVTSLKFSCDGKYLAISDMSGKIRVYLIENLSLFWSYDIQTDLESLSWHPSCNVLFCGTNEGQFMMFKISTNEIKIMYNGDNCILSCFIILKDGTRAACCYNNGNIRIWDLKSAQPLFNMVKSHENDIICLDLSPDGNLLATAGLDMKVRITHTTTGKLIWTFQLDSMKKDNENNNIEDSIESVAFCKSLLIIACATLNGEINVWDLNTHALRHKLENNAGFSKILWNAQEVLFASTLDGTIQSYDGRNLLLLNKYEGHTSEILDFCINDNFIISASNDNTVKIFKI